MQIDIRTLLLALALLYILVPTSLLMISTGDRMRALYLWCGVSVLSSVGAGLMALRSSTADGSIISLFHLLMILGFIFHNCILLNWIKRLDSKVITGNVLLLMIYLSLLYIIPKLQYPTEIRMVVTLFAFTLLVMHRLFIGLMIYRSAYQVAGKMIAMNALLLLISLLARVIHIKTHPGNLGFFEPSLYQLIAITLMMSAVFLINFAYFNMLEQQTEIKNLFERKKMGIVLEKQTLLENKIDTREQQFNELASNAGINGFAAFSGAIAHEINQPLSAMLLNIDRMINYLKKSNSDPKLISDLLTIKEDNRRSINIIKSIRLLLQDEELNVPTEKVQIDLLVRDAVDICKKDIKNKRIMFTQFYQLKDVEIDGDRTLLLQVVLNLITNAIKATSYATLPEITLLTMGDDNYVFLVLIDNGCGIKHSDTNAIFAPFRSFSNNELHKGLGVGLGLGLGLSIIKSILKRNHGDVGYFNNDVDGVTFVAGLPRKNETPAYLFNEAGIRQLIAKNTAN